MKLSIVSTAWPPYQNHNYLNCKFGWNLFDIGLIILNGKKRILIWISSFDRTSEEVFRSSHHFRNAMWKLRVENNTCGWRNRSILIHIWSKTNIWKKIDFCQTFLLQSCHLAFRFPRGFGSLSLSLKSKRPHQLIVGYISFIYIFVVLGVGNTV